MVSKIRLPFWVLEFRSLLSRVVETEVEESGFEVSKDLFPKIEVSRIGSTFWVVEFISLLSSCRNWG